MTAQIIPFAGAFPGMENMDPAMMMQMMQQIAELQKEQRQKQAEQKRSNNWRNVSGSSKPQNGMDPLMGCLLMSMLFGGFADPILQSFGSMAQNIESAAQLGLMNIAENGNQPTNTMAGLAKTNDDLGMSALLMSGMAASQKSGGGMNIGNLMLMMALLKMMYGHNENGEGSSGKESGEMLATDPLRDPKLARFKQNRQTISCIKTSFMRQLSDVTTCPKRQMKLAM